MSPLSDEGRARISQAQKERWRRLREGPPLISYQSPRIKPSSSGFQGPGKRLADASVGPWKRWKGLTRHGRAIRFIETYCAAPKGKGFGEPLKLGAFQKEWLEEILAEGVGSAVLATPRGNGKSSFGGSLGVWALYDDDDTGAPQVPVVATTMGQAVRSCYGVAAAMVRANPELASRALMYSGVGTVRIAVPFNQGEMFPISNDVDGLQGLDPSFGIFDEIGFQDIDSWNSLRMASGKRERSLVIGVGTPGLDKQNALWQLRTRVREGERIPGFVYREFAADENCALDDRAQWRKANPALEAGFLRESALETDLALAGEAAFRAFRLGQWVEGIDAWLGPDGAKVWEGLTSPWGFRVGDPTWVGVDVGRTRDTSAVVALQRRDDGRLHAVAKIWTPVNGGPLDTSDLMAYLRELDSLYDLSAVAYDPRLFEVPGDMLADEGLPMVEVPQSAERMTVAVMGLHEAIQKKEITHDGDQQFASHVLNAVARYNDRGFTLSKGKSRGKIDAAIALALAYDQSARNAGEPSVYESRGMLTL